MKLQLQPAQMWEWGCFMGEAPTNPPFPLLPPSSLEFFWIIPGATARAQQQK